MLDTVTVKEVQDAGIAIFLAISLVWVVRTLVLHTIVRLSAAIDKLIERMDLHNEKLCDKIERHDQAAAERGRYVREEHKQMIETLGRINGYKEK